MGYICEECGFHLDGGVEYKKVWLVSCEVTAQWWQTVGGGWGTCEACEIHLDFRWWCGV